MSFYVGYEEQTTNWGKRKPLILDIIQNSYPDIISLQGIP